MAYAIKNYQTKKALKEDLAKGTKVRCYNPGLGPDLTNYTGEIDLEGPHYPQPHKWYVRAVLKNGLVVKVT